MSMKKHDRLPDFSKLCAPEQTPISFFLSQQIYFFFLGSIVGFLWEVAIFLYRDKTFANRGFFYGPWLPVYGIGAVLFYLLLGCRRKKIHPAGVFFLSAAIGTGLELLIGWFLDAFWNLRYWDYSDQPFNINGYVCLGSSIAWGFLTIFMAISAYTRRSVSASRACSGSVCWRRRSPDSGNVSPPKCALD